jgi:hypothetical protein
LVTLAPQLTKYRGIASRALGQTFDLADHVTVEGASLENGLLTIGKESLDRDDPVAAPNCWRVDSYRAKLKLVEIGAWRPLSPGLRLQG